MRYRHFPLILSFSRKGRRNAVASASVPPLPLRERAGVRGSDFSRISDSGN
jgi:hypothetical protein